MEEPLSFVRDNPFVKNDGCRRLFRRSPVSANPRSVGLAQQLPAAVQAGIPSQLAYGIPKGSRTEKSTMDSIDVVDDRQDAISTGSGSDIEYGPGIVEKLKAKFHRLSGMASKDAKVSPHATFKRCPSMDDILASPEAQHNNNVLPATIPQETLSPIHRVHSKSTGDMLADAEEERRSFTVHRNVRIEQEEEPEVDIPSISTLRRKFEQNVHRRPSHNLRHAKAEMSPSIESRGRPVSMDLSNHDISLSRDAPPPRSMRLVEATRHNDFSLSTHIEYAPPLPSGGPPAVTSVPIRASSTEPPRTEPVRPIALEREHPYDAPTRPQSTPLDRTREAMFGDPSAAPQLRVFEAKKTPLLRNNEAVKPPLRVLEVLNRAVVATEEPEFVKIGRRLRRSSAHLEDREDLDERLNSLERSRKPEWQPTETVQDEDTHHYVETTPTKRPEQPAPIAKHESKKFGLRGHVEFPSLTSHARVIREGSVRPSEVMSPPDPDSARQRQPYTGAALLSPTFIHTDEVRLAPDASPPPEEPMHRELTSPMSSYVRPSSMVSPPQVLPASNDGSGMTEMQRLLNRFQKSRGGRNETTQEEIEPRPVINHQPQPVTVAMSPRVFVPAVVGVRSSDGSDVTRPSPVPQPYVVNSPVPRPNVVSISVRNDAPSVIYTNQSIYEDDADILPAPLSTTKRQAPLPPPPTEAPPPPPAAPPSVYAAPPVPSTPVPPPPSSTVEPRKSLSAKYLEEKSKQQPVVQREKPYGDDYTELKSEPKESSVDDEPSVQVVQPVAPSPVVEAPTAHSEVLEDSLSKDMFYKDSDYTFSSDSESDDPPIASRPFTINFPEPLLAGDGNPVRHTLLSLVMEEDIPSLMEAMSEKYAFEFVDLDNRPSTSSIIHPMEKRQQRRRERQVTSIRFESSAPNVYTYLDEVSAISTQHWAEGAELDYGTYQRLVQAEVDELEANMAELHLWRQNTVTQASPTTEPPTDDFTTNRFSYTNRVDSNTTISV